MPVVRILLNDNTVNSTDKMLKKLLAYAEETYTGVMTGSKAHYMPRPRGQSRRMAYKGWKAWMGSGKKVNSGRFSGKAKMIKEGPVLVCLLLVLFIHT